MKQCTPTKRRVVNAPTDTRRNLVFALFATLVILLIAIFVLRSTENAERSVSAMDDSAVVAVLIGFEFDGSSESNMSPVSLRLESLHGEEGRYSKDMLLDPARSELIRLAPGAYRVIGNTPPVLSDGSVFVDTVEQEFVVESGFPIEADRLEEMRSEQTVTIGYREKRVPSELTDEQLKEIAKKLEAFGIESSYFEAIRDGRHPADKEEWKDTGGLGGSEPVGDADNASDEGTAATKAKVVRAEDIVGYYETQWPSEGAEYNPCYSVHIYSVDGDKVTLAVDKVGRNLSFLVGTGNENLDGITGTLDNDGLIHFSYTEDGWFGEGYGTIDVQGDELVINVVATHTDDMARPGATLDTNGPLTLRKTPYVQR